VNDAGPQLLLFANFESSSSCDAPSSHPSSAPKTFSSEASKSKPTAATPIIPTHPAKESSARDGVDDAESSFVTAKRTAESAQLRIDLICTTPTSTADPMFAIPRPKTRAECRDEARPCPWVGCRHHLLLEVAKTRPTAKESRAMSLRLNRATPGRTLGGRRPGLRSSAAAEIVRAWIDEAVELLSYMPYTCSLDVVDAFPDGLSPRRVGWLLAVTEQAIDAEGRKPHVQEALEALKEFMLR
jgi:hypothetical protein